MYNLNYANGCKGYRKMNKRDESANTNNENYVVQEIHSI